MNYLAEKDVVHFDLVDENILTDENFNIKISDFGLARIISEIELDDIKTTPKRDYILPIDFCDTFTQWKYVDVWAFGLLALRIFSFKNIYKTLNREIWDYKEHEKLVKFSKRQGKIFQDLTEQEKEYLLKAFATSDEYEEYKLEKIRYDFIKSKSCSRFFIENLNG
jgi:serine/threonine protein kinase